MACFTHLTLIRRPRSENPLECLDETYTHKLEGWGGENSIINSIITYLLSIVFDWSTRVTAGRTTAYRGL